MKLLHQKINQTINKNSMLEFGDKVLIAVSGGADSLALLFSLNDLKGALGLRLHIAHLDHMLRPNSFKDLLYVKSIAQKLSIPFSAKRINLIKSGKKGSLEEIARDARIDFFVRTARKIGADKIALGHTKSDLAETVIMRIIRGSGLYGLSSILPKRNINGITFIRPLIEIERNETEAFVKKLKVKPLNDYTNFEDKFLRNKIRHKLLPHLAKNYNPKIKDSLSNLAQTSSLDYELIEGCAKASLAACLAKQQRGKVSLDLKRFLKLSKSLQRMVFRLAVERLSLSTRRLTFKHWQEFEDFIYSVNPSSTVDLPRLICASKQKGKIVLTIRNA